MGLDFSHSYAHWSYGGFHRFREALAKHEGFDLTEMAGFGESADDRPRRSWDEIDTPLKPLLHHSDCEGDLSPEECRQVAPRLREVIDALWPEAASDPESRHHRSDGLALADGMDSAAHAGERLEFQ